jgi:hypothetical protein
VGRPATVRRASAAGVWAAARRREAVATRCRVPQAGQWRGEGQAGRGGRGSASGEGCEGHGVAHAASGVGRAAWRGVRGARRRGAARGARGAAWGVRAAWRGSASGEGCEGRGVARAASGGAAMGMQAAARRGFKRPRRCGRATGGSCFRAFIFVGRAEAGENSGRTEVIFVGLTPGPRKYATFLSVKRPTKITAVFSWAGRQKYSPAHENTPHFRRSRGRRK